MNPKLLSLIAFGLVAPNFAVAADQSDQPPRIKYEAIGRPIPVENLSPETRLQQACNDTKNLRENLKAYKLNTGTSVMLAALQHVACGDSKGGPQP